MKKEIKVFVRTHSELAKIIKSNPFGKTKADDQTRSYVFFLYKEPEIKLKSSIRIAWRSKSVPENKLKVF